MLIVLPPSEGKALPHRGRPLALAELSFPSLTEPREEVLRALVGLCSKDPARAVRTLGLGPTQAGQVELNQRLLGAPRMRANRLYTGVLYDALDLAGLDATARRRASRRLLITSALFGLLRPQDQVPAYRLAGSVSLPGLGPVAGHWRARLGPVMCEAAGDGLVVDLRSSTYAAFWRPPRDRADRVVTVRVLQDSGGRRSVVSHFNKATKGRIARDLLVDGGTPRTPGDLADQLAGLGWRVEYDGRILDVLVTDP